jgi:iron-sulfur cluster assembly accessory protein
VKAYFAFVDNSHLFANFLKDMIHITPDAAAQIKALLGEKQPVLQNGGLRIKVEGGGCSGMQYVMSLDESRTEDKVFNDHGAQVIIDSASLVFVDDSTIDFASGLTSTGFRIINPKAKQTCGCGTSFEA